VTNVPLNGANLRGAVDLSSLVRQPPAAPGTAPAAPSGSLVREATDATFTEVLELSNSVPVIVEFYGAGIEASLGAVVTSYGGRLALATVDGDANPQLAQAFQVQQVPTIAAVIGGRPLQLFAGLPPEAEIRAVLDQVLEAAAQNGVTGVLPASAAPGDPDVPAEPVEEPLPPHHQEAYDAIASGDYAAAVAEYKLAIAQNPRDALAVAGLAQVSLLQRLDGAVADEVRAAAASAPGSVAAQLAVADLDVAGGHLDDAFDRVLELFPTLDQAGKDAVRARLLDYFEIAGAEDPRVVSARRRLSGLLY
jgi:putative thioredoxin